MDDEPFTNEDRKEDQIKLVRQVLDDMRFAK